MMILKMTEPGPGPDPSNIPPPPHHATTTLPDPVTRPAPAHIAPARPAIATSITIADISAPSTFIGQAATFKVTVEPRLAGGVQFSINGHPSSEVVPVVGNQAEWITADLPLGAFQVEAMFTPADPAYATSVSTSLTHQVQPAKVNVEVLPPTPGPENKYTLKAKVTVARPAHCNLNGSVRFLFAGRHIDVPYSGETATASVLLDLGRPCEISAVFTSTDPQADGAASAPLSFTPN